MRYKINLGFPIEFTADNDAQFLSNLRKSFDQAKSADDAFLRQVALNARECTGQFISFKDVSNFKCNLLDAGAMEVFNA